MSYYHTNNKAAVMAYPHYSDSRFSGNGAVIFGEKAEGLWWIHDEWVYDDRLGSSHDTAWDAAITKHGQSRTAARIETYLRHYYDDKDLRLACVIGGYRPFDGYAWYVYGFVPGKVAEETNQ